VHPDDQAVVTQGAAEVLAARGGRVITDSGVSRGGCLVESDIGSIDATMETRWRRAAAALGCDEAWNGGASPVGATVTVGNDEADKTALPAERRA
jgi:flagellar assembly protein FliH